MKKHKKLLQIADARHDLIMETPKEKRNGAKFINQVNKNVSAYKKIRHRKTLSERIFKLFK